MFAAAGDDDLRRLVSQAVLPLEFVGDRLAQFGDAGGGSVFGEAVGQRLGAGIFDMLRRVEVRLARPEAYDILSLGLHLLGLRVNGKRQRRRERRRTARDFIVHTSETDTSSFTSAQAGSGSTEFMIYDL